MSSQEIKVEVVSRVEAGEILCSPDLCEEITFLVSIGDANDSLPLGYENVDHKLRLLIADVVTEEGATEEDVQRIIHLAEQLQSYNGRVLIHCEAGAINIALLTECPQDGQSDHGYEMVRGGM